MVTLAQEGLPNIIIPENYGVKEEFDVYDIERDSTGYIYMTGNAGIQQFNGETFRSLWNGRPSDIFISFFKDNFDRIWTNGHGGSLAYIEKGELHLFAPADSLKKLIGRGVESIYVDSNRTLHLGLRVYGYYTITEDGQINKEIGRESGLHGFVIRTLPDGEKILFSILQKGADQKSNLMVYSQIEDERIDTITELSTSKALYRSSLVADTDSTNILSFGGKDIICIKGNKLLNHTRYSSFIQGVFYDTKGNLWIGTIDNGIQKVKKEHVYDFEFHHSTQFLDGSATVLMEDDHGGLWSNSDSLNFVYVPYPNITSIVSRPSGEMVTRTKAIASGRASVYYINKKNQIAVLSDDSLSFLEAPLNLHPEIVEKVSRYPKSLKYDSINNGLWALYRGQVAFWNYKEWKVIELDFKHFREQMVRDIEVLPNGSILIAASRNILLYDNGDISILYEGENSVLCISANSIEDIWIGQKDGVWKLKDGKLERPSKSYPDELKGLVLDIVQSNGQYWIAPLYLPLYSFSNGQFTPVLSETNDKIYAADVSLAPNGSLWVRQFNSSQLTVFSEKNGEKVIGSYLFDDVARNVITVKSFSVTNDKVYWGSYKGVFTAEKDDLTNELPNTKVGVREVRINQQPVPIQNNYELDFFENSIHVRYERINYRTRSVYYRYRLIGFDTNWVEEEFQVTQYTNLAPGSYQFEVAAKVENEPWGKPRKIMFEILPPFWKTWWFITLEGFLGLTIVWLIIRFREKQLLLKERRKAELSRLELRALKAQINPHFIFNSIASVQYYLGMNKTIDAEHYLQRFSQLMRKVLENSEHSKVLLKDEIELMNNYVGLESERFQGDPIQLEVKLNDLDTEKVFIQPTLLQPYIENAIRHGLRDKKGKRTIQLIFTRVDAQMRVDIIDNGIGRKAADKMQQSSERRSFGMLISNRRIELMNDNPENAVQYVDLEDDKGNSLGTHVTFVLNITQTT
jgi:hypothetical protein